MSSKQQQKPPSDNVAKGSYAIKIDSEVVIFRLTGNSPFDYDLEWREVNRMNIEDLPKSDYRGVTWERTDTGLWMYATHIQE